MKLTSLGGAEKGGLSSPACFSLDICHTRVLLECPVDLSALLWFLPTVLPGNDNRSNSLGPHAKAGAGGPVVPSSSSRSSLAGKATVSGTIKQPSDQVDSLHSAAKRARLATDCSTASENDSEKKRSWIHHFKDVNGKCFLDAAPGYKTPHCDFVDVSSLNVVIISNPVAMLGLPFLVRDPDFTAKIYATDATAKLGQLMMEELVALHSEFIQIYGRSVKSTIPTCLLPDFCAALPSGGRELTFGSNGVGEQWHRLYSTVDIRGCMARVHRLHYGEEVDIDGFISVKPSSSGFGIGASNWVLKGPYRSVSYISTSVSTPNHAMPLDISALEGSQVLLFSCGTAMESLADESCETERKEAGTSENSAEFKGVETSTQESHPPSEGVSAPKQSSQRMSPSPSSSVSPAPVASTGGNLGGVLKLSSSVLLPATPEKSGKCATEENESARLSSSLALEEQMWSICKAAAEALGGGGCVLIPINLYGMFLELIEKMCSHLRSAGLENIPIYYTSPVAEELLAYANTVPEWLSPGRQEKLYAGESLFGFVEALQERRLHHLPTLHSSDLMKCWQEPCVVFAPHWSLRFGPAVHLLQHWRNNPHSLLVLTEPSVDQELLLAPFRPFCIRVLNLPVLMNLRCQDILSIIQKLKPLLTVVSENLKDLEALKGAAETSSGLLWCYKMLKTLKIPSFQNQNNLEVELSADLALQLQLKQVKSGKVAALRAELHAKDGHWSLDTASPSTYSRGTPVGSLPRYQIRWGDVDIDFLLATLRDRGMYDLNVIERLEESGNREESDCKVVIIQIKSPSQADIEVSSSRINVHANELSFRRLIVEVVNSALTVL